MHTQKDVQLLPATASTVQLQAVQHLHPACILAVMTRLPLILQPMLNSKPIKKAKMPLMHPPVAIHCA